MRLIFNSKGLETEKGRKQIFEVIKNDNLEKKTIFVVSLPDYDVDSVIKENLKMMGFAEENIYFADQGNPGGKIDYIYATAGNTFEVLDWMKKEKVYSYIMELAKEENITYIGSSAGAIIAGQDIKVAKVLDRNFVRLEEMTGLGLFDGTIIPHYTQEQLKKYIEESDSELINSYKSIYSVDNESVLVLSV